jgi:hypothetical protein
MILFMRYSLSVLLGLVFYTPALAQQTIVLDDKAAAALSKPEDSQNNNDYKKNLIDRYAFYISADNVRITLVLNGVPLFFRSVVKPEEIDFTFNEWVRRGANRVEVRLEKLDSFKPYSIQYGIYYQSPSQLVSGIRTMVYASTPSMSLPLRQTITIDASSVPELLPWAGTEITLDEVVRSEIVSKINELRSSIYDAFKRGDNQFIATYNRMIEDDLAKAYGQPVQNEAKILTRRREVAALLTEAVTLPVVASEEVTLADLDFELLAEKHLVRISRKNQKPLIDISQGKMRVQIEKPYYAILSGIPARVR